MKVHLGDALPSDPGLQDAVSQWAADTNSQADLSALNSGLPTASAYPAAYIAAGAAYNPALGTFSLSSWLSANSTVIVAGCALVGLLIAMGKK